MFYVEPIHAVWTRYSSVRERSAKTTIWRLPDDDEHVLNTGSPEDLLIDPEDVDIEVARVQESSTVWSPLVFEESDWTVEDFYTAEWDTEDFYTADWTVFPEMTSEFYVSEI